MVFEMKHYQGLKLRAIGDALGTTEETVKNSLFRATRKLRAQLEGLLWSDTPQGTPQSEQSIRCEEIESLAILYACDELDAGARANLDAHVAQCPACAAIYCAKAVCNKRLHRSINPRIRWTAPACSSRNAAASWRNRSTTGKQARTAPRGRRFFRLSRGGARCAIR